MKLNRKQKLCRNILVILLLGALCWAIQGFPAFSTAQAVRWRAVEYGLTENTEVLYASDWTRGDRRDVVFRCGDRLGVTLVYKPMFLYQAWDMVFYKEQPITVLYQTNTLSPTAMMLYCADPAAAEVECTLGLYGLVNDRVFEETYLMTAIPNSQGVCRFEITPKHNGTVITARQMDEEIMLRDFQLHAEGGGDRDSRHSVSVVVRDGGGKVIGTYEERLYEED